MYCIVIYLQVYPQVTPDLTFFSRVARESLGMDQIDAESELEVRALQLLCSAQT